MPKEFLQEGAKVRAYVFFKGRSILFKDQGAICCHVSSLNWKNTESGRLSETGRKEVVVVLAPEEIIAQDSGGKPVVIFFETQLNTRRCQR